ncbi:hypothetical protein XBFFL1_1980009 [Xenorhabdus bovienii str. feltiae Florida]|nr:hypothetical protein XBFFR1_1460007 [Xenorhabdus bovienii str. feltiae France]CDG92098.1 hypothetical protein XBFFL1_1980009 [Xenorhabdus bovienii str. feltiae Florida]
MLITLLAPTISNEPKLREEAARGAMLTLTLTMLEIGKPCIGFSLQRI